MGGVTNSAVAGAARVTEKQLQAQVVQLARLTGRLRPAQAAWLEALAEVERAPEVYLWRPADFGDIQSTLRRGAA